MFIEHLDKNKIKVVVDLSEQEEFGVTYETMTYSDGNTRKLCESIMEKAKNEVGFNVGGAKLLVEARQSCDGSVTLYLSKIAAQEVEYDELFGQTIQFKSFDDLCDCREIFSRYDDKIAAYNIFELDKKYYLYFEVVCLRKQAAKLLRSLLEYGEKSKLSPEILTEHGKLVSTYLI